MRNRSLGLTLFGSLAIIVSACGGGATPSPSASTAPSASAPASVAPSESTAPSAAALKIGVVTDVGTLDDKNFNQFSYEGAKKAADDLGGSIQSIVPKAAADYGPSIQSFIDQDYDVIVSVGFALGTDTTIAAKANPDVAFIGVDQSVCVDAAGAPDATFACAGDAATLLPNYQGLVYKEQEPGYLAGIVAASISEKNSVGAIGGINLVPAVVKYIKGFEAGAKSVKADIKVSTAYVSTGDFGVAFNDPSAGKAFAQQFITANGPDVLFQVAGKTGNGVLAAACEAKINAIGVDVDQHLSTPESAACIVTSAEKKLAITVEQAVKRVADGTAKGGTIVNDAKNDGIGLAPFYDMASLITADTQAKIDAALAGFKDGSLEACDPATCGNP
jgi:basic membrane protein A